MARINEPVLVTGGCGFVGRNLVRRLLRTGVEVHVVDCLTSGREPTEWLPNDYDCVHRGTSRVYEYDHRELHFHEADLRDFLRGSGSDKRFGDVFHLAAVVGGRTTIEQEPLHVATDLSIDAEFFNWAVRTRPERILYASSSAAYPVHLQNGDRRERLREGHIQFDGTIGCPDMTYGWSKLTGELLAQTAASDYNLSVAVVRPFSGYGGDQAFDYPIPAIAKRAHYHEDPLTIWGSGNQVRDFVHIEDCIEAILRSIQTITDGSAINIGTGRPTNFWEVAELFADLVGYQPEIRNLPDRPEGPKFRCADTARSERLLDWRPSISLEEGFKRVLNRIEYRATNEL